jgi:galactokinase
VLATVDALRTGDLEAVGRLLDASHRSLRDLYEVSTPAVESAVARLRAAGAIGARIVGGGFGGNVLGLLPRTASVPDGAREVGPAAGARLIDG